MIVFRGCSKCEGDVYVERDLDGADLVCLQCGTRRSIANREPSRYPAAHNSAADFHRAAR